LDGYRALWEGSDPAMLFVFVEKTPPYLVSVVELDQPAVIVGRELNRRALAVYAECRATGVWPGHSPEIELIALPAWATNRLEERSDVCDRHPRRRDRRVRPPRREGPCLPGVLAGRPALACRGRGRPPLRPGPAAQADHRDPEGRGVHHPRRAAAHRAPLRAARRDRGRAGADAVRRRP